MSFVAAVGGNAFSVTAPRDPSVMPPGVYMLFVLSGGVPSQAVWVDLGA